MTLANMRELGVASVDAVCSCGRATIIDVSKLPETVEVPSLRLRMRCSACGRRPMHVRPNWLELRAPGMGAV